MGMIAGRKGIVKLAVYFQNHSIVARQWVRGGGGGLESLRANGRTDGQGLDGCAPLCGIVARSDQSKHSPHPANALGAPD